MSHPSLLDPIIGKRPWSVWKGIGSFMFFEFGRKMKAPAGKFRGAYELWIYMADWLLDRDGKPIAHSESPDRVIEKGAKLLEGKKLESITLITELGKGEVRYAVCFTFEGGFCFHATMYDNGPLNIIFVLHTPTEAISYNYDGNLIKETRMPNQLSEPTLASGTAPAGAGGAPSVAAVH